MVSDELGRDPTLRYERSTLRVNPVTMISKRVERGDEVDAPWLYERTVREIRERVAKGDFD